MARELSLQSQGQQEEGDQSPDRLHHSGHDDDDDDEMEGIGEGEILYRDFVSRRLTTEMDEMTFGPYHQLFPAPAPVRYPGIHYYHTTSRQGRGELSSEFSSLAERFQRSGGREEVRRSAERVDISSINQENLTHLLTELFRDGVTQERVLVLFFFSSDLTLRVLRAGMVSLVSRLTDWVVTFIRRVVSCLVRLEGGWRSLLSSITSHSDLTTVLSLSAALLGLGLLYLKTQS